MEGFLKEGKLEDSKKVLGEILARGTLPLTRVLKFHLIKALLDGDIESFEMIRPKLTNVSIPVFSDFQMATACLTYSFCAGSETRIAFQQPAMHGV